ncbi:hypothetical protein [Pantoea wallisii]|nr:hypothetical protein [Pantoea wallisii]
MRIKNAMFYHDDVQGHKIIGEAAFRLITQAQQVTVVNLIEELIAMSEHEACDERLSLISDARYWLKDHLNAGHRYQTAKSWITASALTSASDKSAPLRSVEEE